MSTFKEYCSKMNVAELDSDDIPEISTIEENKSLSEDDKQFILLMNAYCGNQRVNGLIACMPLPMSVIHECNLKSIRTVEDARKYCGFLSIEARCRLKSLGTIA